MSWIRLIGMVRLCLQNGVNVARAGSRLVPIRISVCLCAMVLARPIFAQSSREVIQRGKGATALLDLPGQKITASAVCIHPSGLFITNHHAIAKLPRGAKIKLVLHPDAEDRRELTATVLRSDSEFDLAVLRGLDDDAKPDDPKADGANPNDGIPAESKPDEASSESDARNTSRAAFEALPLGNDDELFETMQVTAFGFPFGKALSDNNYPEISVNVGRITSLRTREGKLHQIQLDAQLNPGNSGGPVINQNGEVVGIVQAGVLASGVNFAIPVSRLRSFLQRPEVLFQAPTIGLDAVNAPTELSIQVVPFLEPLDAPRVELELRTDGRDPRQFVVQADNADPNQFLVSVVPIIADPGDQRRWLDGVVEFAKGSVQGLLLDQPIEVVGASLQLSDVRSIQFGEQPCLTKHDGTTLEFAPRDLMAQVDLGGLTLELNLEHARRLNLKPLPPPNTLVRYTVVVRQQDRELARVEGILPIAGASGATEARVPRFVSYQGEKQTIELPDTVHDAILAGGGRLLLLHLNKAKKVAVYDVNQAKIVHFLSLGSENAILAAGMDKLIVVLPSDGVLESWSLETFERETVRPLPVSGVVKATALGYASQGPLLIHSAASTDALARASYEFFDLQNFEKLPIADFRGHNSSFRDAVHIRASATGDVFGLWATSHSPQGLESMTRIGDQVKIAYQHDSAGHIVPNFDGSAILTGYAGVLTPELNRKTARGTRTAPTVPSTHPRFYLSVPADPGAQINLGRDPFAGVKPTVHVLGAESRLSDVPALELGKSNENSSWSTNDFTLDKRVVFVPQASQLIVIPYTNDRLIVQPFNLRESLDRAEVDYLYVESMPSRVFRKGETYQYVLEVAAKRGGVRYEMSSGPDGMSVDNAGVLHWSVPADFAATEANVLITIRDADGQTIYESFKMRLDAM